MVQISRAAAHGGNQQQPVVRVNDGPRKLDHSEGHCMKSGSEWCVDIMYGERSILCELQDILELTK